VFDVIGLMVGDDIGIAWEGKGDIDVEGEGGE